MIQDDGVPPSPVNQRDELIRTEKEPQHSSNPIPFSCSILFFSIYVILSDVTLLLAVWQGHGVLRAKVTTQSLIVLSSSANKHFPHSNSIYFHFDN